MKESWVVLFAAFVSCFVSGQDVQSPCPGTFDYREDGGQLFGYITLHPLGEIGTVNVMTNLSIATALPSSYYGKVQPTRPLSELNRVVGAPITYRVHFPVTSPLPRLTSLTVNGNVLCYGPGDVAGPGQYVTTVSLQHTLTVGRGGNTAFSTQPQNEVQSNQNPIINYVNNDGQVFNPNGNDGWTVIQVDSQSPNNVNLYPPVYHQQPNTPRPTKPTQIYWSNWNTQRPPSYPNVQYTYHTPSRHTTRWPPVTTTERTRHPPAPPRAQSVPQCGVTVADEDAYGLIFNGESYERGDWPWLVSIHKKKDGSINFVCAGSLVSDQHIITAAHCMHKRNKITAFKDFVVKVGVYDLEEMGEEYTVSRTIAAAIIHENYNPKTLANDLLVMKFHESVEYSQYIRPLCLWGGNTDLDRIVGSSGVVTGWGKSEYSSGGQGLPRSVRIPIVSTSTCKASKPDFHKLTSAYTLCAGDRKGSGPCSGDSGSGLYIKENHRWQLRGVVSLSLRPESGDITCNLNEYIVFTDTAQYLPWIQKAMRN